MRYVVGLGDYLVVYEQRTAERRCECCGQARLYVEATTQAIYHHDKQVRVEGCNFPLNVEDAQQRAEKLVATHTGAGLEPALHGENGPDSRDAT